MCDACSCLVELFASLLAFLPVMASIKCCTDIHGNKVNSADLSELVFCCSVTISVESGTHTSYVSLRMICNNT